MQYDEYKILELLGSMIKNNAPDEELSDVIEFLSKTMSWTSSLNDILLETNIYDYFDSTTPPIKEVTKVIINLIAQPDKKDDLEDAIFFSKELIDYYREVEKLYKIKKIDCYLSEYTEEVKEV